MKTSFTAAFSSSHPELDLDESSQPSDAELMAAIQCGDQNALEALFHRCHGLLKGTIKRVIHDEASAEDVVQECLLELWRNSHSYSAAKGAPLGWLLTLTRRRAIDHIRRSQAYGRACTRYEDATNVLSISHDTTTDCEQADLGQVLNDHLRLLPEPQQRVISLAFFQGMSQREVAQATRLPLGTVKTRLELGLKKLRRSFHTRGAIHSYQAA